jgi:hypothetical protein
MRRRSFSSLTVGASAPPVWKDAHAPRSVLNSSVKNNGRGVGVTVGAGVKVIVAVAGSGVVVAGCTSTWGGTGVELVHAVRNIIPIKILRSEHFLFMTEL